ncbi:rho-related GTP-binding protein RhoB-like [Guaruba guarouba]
MAALRRKITVVGDDYCGKTYLLFALCNEQLQRKNEREVRDDGGIRKKLATPGSETIITTEGKILAASTGAYAYLECSAKTKGIDAALETIDY